LTSAYIRYSGKFKRRFVRNYYNKRRSAMRTVLLVLIVLLVIGAFPTWPYSAQWGYYPSSGLGLLLLIIILLAVFRRA